MKKRKETEMSKKLFKLNYNLFLGLSVLWILFLLTPSEPIFAHFSDTASANAGIKLTLGNLALSPENDETFTGLTYSGGDPMVLSSHHLKNKGTLNGKLAYQIQVTEKGTDTPVDDSGMQLILSFNSALGDKTIPISEINSSKYTFITDNEGKEWIFDTNQKENLPVTIKYKSTDTPEKDREIEITVTFLLVQTNASEPKETMFYDKVSFKHELKLKAKEEPAPIDPDYWPATDDKNWKKHEGVRYNDAQFEKIMYFSEVESSNQVHNLNDNVLYIELPEGKSKEDNDFRITQADGSKIKAEIMQNRRYIKLTFSFELPTKEAGNIISRINYYTVSFNYGETNSSSINFDFKLLPLANKRILLSSDVKVPGPFELLPTYTTLEQKKITFKYVTENYDIPNNNGSYINESLSDAKLPFKEIEATVIENSTLFDLSVHKASEGNNQDYLLINTNKDAKPADLNKNGKLKILITGNNGERLVIYRDLYITKETKQMVASQAIAQNKYDLKVEETQTEQEESVVEKQAVLEETEKSNDLEKAVGSNQTSSSEEQIAEDSSVKVPEEQDAAEETLPPTESIPENSASATENQDTDKEAPVQENEFEEAPLENEIKVDTSPPEDSLNN